MTDTPIKIKALNEHVVESITTILWSEEFPKCTLIPQGVLALVDGIASYHEEGKELFPHIVLTTELTELLKSIPFVQKIVIRDNALSEVEFQAALKLCAPLAIEGWIIFVAINDTEQRIQFGLLSSELSETSPSLHRQLLGDLAPEDIALPFIYISNIGQRTVLIEGTNSNVAISLSLKTVQDLSNDSVRMLASTIVKTSKSVIRDTIAFYFEKLLNFSLKEYSGSHK